MKVVIACIRHETNTFSPVATPLRAFVGRFDKSLAKADTLLSGDAALALFEEADMPFGAFVASARQRQAEVVVPVYANAHPSAPTDRQAFDRMSDAVVEAVQAGCDAVLLDLHGAMVAQGIDDAETELLRRIRQVAPEVPMAVALDFHANLSDEFFEYADVVTGYCTYPHVDTYETGERAAKTLFAWLDGGIKPALVYRRLPMLTHMNCQTPAREPMKSIMDCAMAAEANEDVRNASVFGGFPLADVPQAALLVVVAADSRSVADGLADELAEMAWSRRAEFVYDPEPMAETIARAKGLKEFPVILAEHGNNCGAGGSVDTMHAYREVLDQGLDGVIGGPVCDPRAVAAAISAGVGSEITLDIGGNTDLPAIGIMGEPLRVTARVKVITDGRFTVTGPMMTGAPVDMGATVVLDVGPLQLVVSEDRVEPFDLGVFKHCGLDPQAAKYVLIHSRQHFRAGFEPIAAHIEMVAGPGVCTSDYHSLPFERLARPIYPLDPDTTYTGA
jgi:microcystin degradation protein MlrC